MTQRRAVVGIAFNESVTRVLLIEKKRPRWQAGYLNGVGGKVEEGEEPLQAMSREFEEETGIALPPGAWVPCITYRGPDFEVHFYRIFLPDDLFDSAKTTTDEKVIPYTLDAVPRIRTIYNLQWVIPLMMDPNVKWPILVEKSDG